MRFARLLIPGPGHPQGKRSGRDVGTQSGFTLLEMLVAISVLSIAALALVRLDAFTLRSTADLSASTAAQIVASNKAVDFATDPAAPTIGVAQDVVSNGGQSWRITSRIAATADPSLLRIDIAVTGNGGRANLTIIRPAG